MRRGTRDRDAIRRLSRLLFKRDGDEAVAVNGTDLGRDVDLVQLTDRDVGLGAVARRPAVDDRHRDGPFVLTVGTIEVALPTEAS